MFYRAVLLGALGGLAVFIAAILTKAPQTDLDWQPHLSIQPAAQETDGGWQVAPVRNWTYTAEGPASTDWETGAAVSPAEVRRVWLLVEPHPGLAVMAHTLVLFEFGDGALIGLTIEARKEIGETFAPVRGALRRFELIYVWATPRDLITRRAVFLDRALQLYPLELTPDQAQAYLSTMLARTQALAERPRFYNTLHSNCTNELAKAAGLGWQPAFVLTGRAARALHKRGLIAGETFDGARSAGEIGDWARANAGLPEADFNRALLAHLRQRRNSPIENNDLD